MLSFISFKIYSIFNDVLELKNNFINLHVQMIFLNVLKFASFAEFSESEYFIEETISTEFAEFVIFRGITELLKLNGSCRYRSPVL